MRRMIVGLLAVMVTALGGSIGFSPLGVALVSLGAITLGVLISSATAAVEMAQEVVVGLWRIVHEFEDMSKDNQSFGIAADRLRRVLVGGDK